MLQKDVTIGFSGPDGQTVETTMDALEKAVEEMTPEEPEGKYIAAHEVYVLANKLISSVKRFGHLAEARIAYLFRNTRVATDWMSKDRVVMGKAYVNDDRQRFLSDIDLQVVINRRVWEIADATQREALLAHELCHFEPKEPDKDGNPRWSMANHDLEEFSYIVRKYGIWDESLRRFMAAYTEGKIERNQVKMFPADDESDSA